MGAGRFNVWPWSAALLLAVWWLSFHPMRTADLWWHLAAGRWIVEHRTIPGVDPFSFSAYGQRWLNHEWLADVLYHLWAILGGLKSLVYWYWGALIGTYLLLFHLCRKLGGAMISSFLAVTLAAATAVPFFELRPHLYSLLLYVVLLWLLLPGRKLGLGLPLLFVLWVNLHGGFIFGLVTVATVVLTRLLTKALRPPRSAENVRLVLAGERRNLLVAAVSALVCLINPYGDEIFVLPLSYALDARSPFRELKEWLPPFSAGGVSSPFFPWLIVLFFAACAALLWLARKRWRMEPETLWPLVALGGVTLVMALRSGRFIPLFAISASLPISLFLTGAAAAARRQKRTSQPSAVGKAIPLLIAAACLVLLTRFPLGRRAFSHLTSLESFPIDTLNFIDANALSGRVFAYYGWGGYVDYRTDARMKVYIDSRANTVYSPTIFNQYRRVQYMLPNWVEVVEASGADYFLWLNLETPQVQRFSQPEVLVATGRWRKVREGFASVLLAKTTVRLPPERPERASPYHELALSGSAMRTGNKPEAEAHLRAALALDPDSLAACRNLALVLAWEDRPADAWAQHRRCEKIFPEPESETVLRKFIAERHQRLGRSDLCPFAQDVPEPRG
jgi:hypothetical protein